MKRYVKSLVSILLAVVMLFTFVGCDDTLFVVKFFDGTEQIGKDVAGTSSKVIVPVTAPTKVGYTFEGWFDAKIDGNKFVDGTKFTQNITYYARYTKDAEPTVTYTVKFFDGDIQVGQDVVGAPEQVIVAPTAPTKAGFIFTGWFDQKVNGDKLEKDAKFTKNISYYARYIAEGQSPTTFTVKFFDGLTQIGQDVVGTAEQLIVPPMPPAKKGFVFSGWYDQQIGGTKLPFGAKFTKNVTYYARYEVMKTEGEIEGDVNDAVDKSPTLSSGNVALDIITKQVLKKILVSTCIKLTFSGVMQDKIAILLDIFTNPNSEIVSLINQIKTAPTPELITKLIGLIKLDDFTPDEVATIVKALVESTLDTASKSSTYDELVTELNKYVATFTKEQVSEYAFYAELTLIRDYYGNYGKYVFNNTDMPEVEYNDFVALMRSLPDYNATTLNSTTYQTLVATATFERPNPVMDFVNKIIASMGKDYSGAVAGEGSLIARLANESKRIEALPQKQAMADSFAKATTLQKTLTVRLANIIKANATATAEDLTFLQDWSIEWKAIFKDTKITPPQTVEGLTAKYIAELTVQMTSDMHALEMALKDYVSYANALTAIKLMPLVSYQVTQVLFSEAYISKDLQKSFIDLIKPTIKTYAELKGNSTKIEPYIQLFKSGNITDKQYLEFIKLVKDSANLVNSYTTKNGNSLNTFADKIGVLTSKFKATQDIPITDIIKSLISVGKELPLLATTILDTLNKQLLIDIFSLTNEDSVPANAVIVLARIVTTINSSLTDEQISALIPTLLNSLSGQVKSAMFSALLSSGLFTMTTQDTEIVNKYTKAQEITRLLALFNSQIAQGENAVKATYNKLIELTQITVTITDFASQTQVNAFVTAVKGVLDGLNIDSLDNQVSNIMIFKLQTAITKYNARDEISAIASLPLLTSSSGAEYVTFLTTLNAYFAKVGITEIDGATYLSQLIAIINTLKLLGNTTPTVTP
ncbi:MAG: InlB B-repeat-containing protein [Clostridia bacterium]